MPAQQPYGEMPPHWASDAIQDVIATRDPKRIARVVGDAIANSDKVQEAIENTLNEEVTEGLIGPGVAHRVRRAIADAIGEYT